MFSYFTERFDFLQYNVEGLTNMVGETEEESEIRIAEQTIKAEKKNKT